MPEANDGYVPEFNPDDPDDAEVIEIFSHLLHGLQVEQVIQGGTTAALNEFINTRWPHLVKHGVINDDDADNPFTGGVTLMFVAMVEIRGLDDLFTDMRQANVLPDVLCPLASLVRYIRTAAEEAEMRQRLHDGAVIPPHPGMN